MKKFLLILSNLLFFGGIFCFTVPEKLTFSLEYGMITAGEATLSISEENYNDFLFENGDTIKVYKIVSTAKTNSFFDVFYKVRDSITSIWDIKKKVPLEFSKNLSEGSYRQKRTHYYFHDKKLSLYKKYDFETKKYSDKMMKISAGTQDILSCFYLTRMQEIDSYLDSNEPFYINVTADGDNYLAKAVFLGKEKIYSPYFDKEVECYKVRPVLANNALFKNEGKIYMYLTADEQKIPILLESEFLFGKFKAILRKVEK